MVDGKIELVVFDFDGVLTDNRVLVFENGTEAVFCNRSDGLGFQALHHAEIKTLILSTEENPVVSARGKKIKVTVLQGIADKRLALEEWCANNKIGLKEVMFVGNDVNDKSAMEIVGYSVVPADANVAVIGMADFVLESKGGEGVVREVAEKLLNVFPPY